VVAGWVEGGKFEGAGVDEEDWIPQALKRRDVLSFMSELKLAPKFAERELAQGLKPRLFAA
jgi:hypothetical protein